LKFVKKSPKSYYRNAMKYELYGLYVITDKKLVPRARFVETVEKSLKGGARIVQLREKDTPSDEIVELGRRLIEVTRRYDAPLLIDDYPVLAREIGADGVHLGSEDTTITEARRIMGGEAIIGVSCYGSIQRGIEAEKEGANYLAFGTPFFTPTKPEREPTPFSVLIKAKETIKDIPVFAIGGINIGNARLVLNTGVDGIAVVTSVFGSPDPEAASQELSALFHDRLNNIVSIC
jgi:thiamine-phosphate pyrophosphorylase